MNIPVMTSLLLHVDNHIISLDHLDYTAGPCIESYHCDDHRNQNLYWAAQSQFIVIIIKMMIKASFWCNVVRPILSTIDPSILICRSKRAPKDQVHCCTLSLCYLGAEMINTEIQIQIQRSSSGRLTTKDQSSNRLPNCSNVLAAVSW